MHRLLAFTLIFACAKQAPATVPNPSSQVTMLSLALPESPYSTDFAELLVTTPVTDWSPTDDRSFEYRTLMFTGDGTFSADAMLSAGGETIPCREQGTWSVEAVESATTGTIEMRLETTDCATRSSGSGQRIRLAREADRYRIAYR